MRTGHTNIIRKEHECFWFDGANDDPFSGLLCLHGYRPESQVKDKPGVNQTATVLIDVGRYEGCC